MTENYDKKAGPVVSVLIPTFNRPRYLVSALASVLRQSYRRLQVIVVNDGGVDVSEMVNSFHDRRVILINRKQNLGKPHSLNEALERAEGKYVAYLDDDDLYYPHHIETLVSTLEGETDCQVAYSDFYKSYCRVSSDGNRQVLSKVVEVSRDFDRFFMLHFNHVLHVCLMHRRDLIERTGPYNEQLNVLIDWDMTRRLVFFSDFHHVCEVTGEYCHPMGDCDRISVQRRKDKNEYARNVLAIRTSRPPEPWTKIREMSIIFAGDRLDRQAGATIGAIWRHTFYPYKLYLPLPASDFNRFKTDMPNLVRVPVDPASSSAQRVDAALAQCDGDTIALAPAGLPIKDMWIENPLYALMNNPSGGVAFEAEGSTDKLWAAAMSKNDLLGARRDSPDLPVRESLRAAGMVLRSPDFEELPFQFDNLLLQARSEEKEGNYLEAAHMFEYIAEHHGNALWMHSLAAKAFFKAGEHARAAEFSHRVNQRRPTIDTLLLEAKVKREQKDFGPAIELLRAAEQILSDSDSNIPVSPSACEHSRRAPKGYENGIFEGNDSLWT
ncbi:MAG: glycosyltransferase [Phycisphaerales bacterium]|nr:MAG: glycosyltransferase [Phycisphaerales bacterium]